MKKLEIEKQFNKLANTIESYVQKSLVSLGNMGIQDLTFNEHPLDKGRLEDSFSYATAKKESGVGARAKPSDQVEKPDTTDAVNVGTQVPYATTLEHGSGSFDMAIDGDGNPETFQSLLPKIKAWMGRKGIEDDGNFAYNITRRILEYGSDAQPFFYESFRRMETVAPNIIKAQMEQWLIKSKPKSTDVVKISIKY